MLVVIDTNVMLSAFARQSPIALLFRALASGRLRLAVTAAIVLEYEEISAQRGGASFSARVMHWLSLVAAAHHTIEMVHPSFQFHIVTYYPNAINDHPSHRALS